MSILPNDPAPSVASTPLPSRAPVVRAPSAAEANAAIREFCAGRWSWTQADQDELERLRLAWWEASRAELAVAA